MVACRPCVLLTYALLMTSSHPKAKTNIDHLRRFDDDEVTESGRAAEAMLAAMFEFAHGKEVVTVCDLCEGVGIEVAAAIHCAQCGVHMCDDCNTATHDAANNNKAAMMRHVRSTVHRGVAEHTPEDEPVAWSNVFDRSVEMVK